ncbi:MAG: radical SAM family heme chaperone HemW [Candidatus Thiodiazotropha sp.]
MNLPPVSLYVHIPWCVRKCPYCDFNSHTLNSELPEQAYVAALLKDLRNDLQYLSGRSLASLFIGGGTPSLMSASMIAALLMGVAEEIEFCDSIEITMEANPGAMEAEEFSGYRQAGVNRLSLGVQSLNAESLLALGRIHGPQEVISAVNLAKEAGFKRINLDLMFGLPKQTLEMAQQDLSSAIALNTEHLSYYQLTLEPNTSFHHYPPSLPDEEGLWQMQQQGLKMLAQAGYEQYEISAFARNGAKCQHNMNYWRFGDYLGIGAGAHAKITMPNGQIMRIWKQRHPSEYMMASESGSFIQGQSILNDGDLVVEFMMNALRLHEGVEHSLFQVTTGIPLADIEDKLKFAVDKGLLLALRDRICPSPLGHQFLNDLLGLFEVKGYS